MGNHYGDCTARHDSSYLFLKSASNLAPLYFVFIHSFSFLSSPSSSLLPTTKQSQKYDEYKNVNDDDDDDDCNHMYIVVAKARERERDGAKNRQICLIFLGKNFQNENNENRLFTLSFLFRVFILPLLLYLFIKNAAFYVKGEF